EIQIVVRNVESHHTARLEMFEVQRNSLRSEQMHRNGIPGESVKHEYVERGPGFAFERKPCIAGHDIHMRFRFTQIEEERFSDINHLLVNFIETEVVA